MTGQLANKVALITGAATGLGRAIATRFLAEGACVVSLDRGPTTPPADSGDRFVAVIGDVRSTTDNQTAVQTALDRFGQLDVFVGNAGIYDNRQPFRNFTAEGLDAAFDELFSINVKGYLLGARAALDALAATRGCIIFTGSVSGTHAGFGGALYIAAKHAVTGLTRQLALELAPGVRVNAVAPGYVPTSLRGLESLAQQTSGGPTANELPLQVIGQPEDYAHAYVFLASDAASRIATGTILNLDGGTSVRGPNYRNLNPQTH